LYTHILKAVCEHEDVTEQWKQGVQTARKVLANRPDIVIKTKTYNFLIDRHSIIIE